MATILKMRGLLTILMVLLISSSCKKRLIRNEPIFNDLISEIVDATDLNINDSLSRKTLIGYRKNLAYPLPPDLETIKIIRNYLGHNLKSEQDSIDFLEPLDNLIKREKSDSYTIETDSLNPLGNIEVLSFEKIKRKYPEKKSGNLSVEITRSYFFSNVYFNSNSTKGVFYSSYLCEGDCGYGELIFIEIRNGKWRIVNRLFLWVA
ncbi:hypothetical protein [Flagellimonas lutimaris]|uniref:hypothetical protein n=1 Tax=Flagellimonas lutimaris TaxID=475082 RepID=UPI003F5CCB80